MFLIKSIFKILIINKKNTALVVAEIDGLISTEYYIIIYYYEVYYTLTTTLIFVSQNIFIFFSVLIIYHL